MSNVNGNDIDDLFKRAAEGYPLRTDKSDWASVVADLERDPSLILPPMHTEEDGRRRRRFFWLFLLLPLGGLGYLTWRSGLSHTHPVTRAGQEVSAASKRGLDQQTADATPAPGMDDKLVTAGKTSKNDHALKEVPPAKQTLAPNQALTEKDSLTAKEDHTPKTPADQTSARNDRHLSVPGRHLSAPDRNFTAPDAHSSARDGHSSARDGHSSARDGHSSARDPHSSAPDRHLTASDRNIFRTDGNSPKRDRHLSGTDRTPNGTDRNASAPDRSLSSQDRHLPLPDRSLTAKDRHLSGKDRGSSAGTELSPDADGRITLNKTNTPGANVYKMVPAGSGSQNMHDAAARPVLTKRAGQKGTYSVNIPVKGATAQPLVKDKNTPVKLKKGKPSFYVGLMAAPDISSVKFQSVKGAGTTYSFLLGYNFGSRWSIETGLSLDKKNYYTNGEYFNKSKTPQLQQLDLKKLDGICNMWEIPLNVRYNLSASPGKTKWFATAGLSSYLMTKETYAYTASYIGGGPTWDKTWVYKKPSQYWFSIFNLSIGYEQKLGNIGNLRLEPYLRIPLGGVGTGSLPIMSAGLNIGITRKIW